MTEERLKELLMEGVNGDGGVKTIVEKVTHLIMDAYEAGFNNGFGIAEKVFLKKD